MLRVRSGDNACCLRRRKQTFLFPQISSSAAAEKQRGALADKVTYSFRICELLDKIFHKK